MEKKFLEYLPQFKAFGISDEELDATAKYEPVELVLTPEAYKLLHIARPKKEAPTIGFLLGRDKNYYTVGWNYVRSIAKTGVNLRFLEYDNAVSELEGCQGLILPGGTFESPDEFYVTTKRSAPPVGPRTQAYISCILTALKYELPMLGICAGAQMIAGMHGFKMYRNQESIERVIEIEHQTTKECAHKVFLKKPSSFKNLMGNIPWMWANSRHNESIVPNTGQSELSIYATAEDGVPEAWGNDQLGILCVQWHPEDFATHGNQLMMRIFSWIAEKAAAKL